MPIAFPESFGKVVFSNLMKAEQFIQSLPGLDLLWSKLKRVASFKYDDAPMPDVVYELHAKWIKWLHDYYLRVEHVGQIEEALHAARNEHVILISNHSIALEALLIGYYFLERGAGKIGALVYPEAFKLPLVRELFRSGQCVPISVEGGVKTLKKRHILLFPEGMDFISGVINPNRVPKFHKGFLRIAKQYLKETKKKSVTLIPIGHAGVEHTLKLWVVKNEAILEAFVKPFAKYPFMVLPKLPFLMPSKVIINWGMPIKLTMADLRTERKMAQKANAFRATMLSLRARAKKLRDMRGSFWRSEK